MPNTQESWTSLEEFFDCLNKNLKYVILRNYEDIGEEFLSLLHPDIDFLCADRELFLSIVKSVSRTQNPEDKVHRSIVVGGKIIDIDVRCVGDGYYDTEWEKDILAKRVLYEGRFFVPDKVNYFYSLLYHSLIQKQVVSTDYFVKLNQLAENNGISTNNIISIETLQSFMREKGYMFTYPENPQTRANFGIVDQHLIKRSITRKAHRSLNRYKNFLKHFFNYGRKN